MTEDGGVCSFAIRTANQKWHLTFQPEGLSFDNKFAVTLYKRLRQI